MPGPLLESDCSSIPVVLLMSVFACLCCISPSGHTLGWSIGSEFIVANTLAKWKKLEPNEIDLSQGFSQKVVSRSCSVFNSFPRLRQLLLSADNLCKQFGPRSGPTFCQA